MDCRKIKEILGLYLDGELGESEAALVEEHIAGCAECSAELELTSCLIDAAGALEEIEPPAYLRAAIAEATTQSRRQERGIGVGFGAWVSSLIPPTRIRWAAGAAAAAVVGIALIMSSSHAPDISRQSTARRTAVDTSAPIAATLTPSEDNVTSASIAPSGEKPAGARIAAKPTVRHRHRRVITTASSHKHNKAIVKIALKPMSHAKPAASLDPVDTSVDETIDVAEAGQERSGPEVKPVAETPPDALSEIRPKLVRMASAPLVSPQEAEESIKQIKATAATRRANGGTLTIISTRF